MNYVISFFKKYLMLYACVRRFDVTDTVEKFLGTKRGLSTIAVVIDFFRVNAQRSISYKWVLLRSINFEISCFGESR